MYSDLNMSPEEIAAILEKEQKMNLRLHKLTITKLTNRTMFVKAIRNLFTKLTLAESVKLADNLPFVDEEMWTCPGLIEELLGPHCEYTYEQIPFPGCSDTSIPPWESPKYLEAKKWMESLPEADQEKIHVLIQASMPWG